jgi:MFS superfamily sulfate permease-like transporter
LVVLLETEIIPAEGMAYAGIRGVPPQMSLYAVMAGCFVYSIFGTSEFISKPVLKK